MKIKFKRIDHVQLTIPPAQKIKQGSFIPVCLVLRKQKNRDSLKASGGVWFKIAGGELHLGVETPPRPWLRASLVPKGRECKSPLLWGGLGWGYQKGTRV
ncbi:MAG TPA: hypothetical protein VGK25_11215 [Ignavibacteria bacterium]